MKFRLKKLHITVVAKEELNTISYNGSFKVIFGLFPQFYKNVYSSVSPTWISLYIVE
jgi:hypothetical protein